MSDPLQPDPPRPLEAGSFVREPHESEWRSVDEQKPPLLLPAADNDSLTSEQ
jgi:hypothetical protein